MPAPLITPSPFSGTLAQTADLLETERIGKLLAATDLNTLGSASSSGTPPGAIKDESMNAAGYRTSRKVRRQALTRKNFRIPL